MNDCIIFEGIQTNNLKNIDIALKKKAINLIIGPSGSGKTSLAYDTIAQIGQHEFAAMYADDAAEPSYKVRDYHNMIAAIPIRQTNINNNMHSTIGTYFGLNRTVAFVYAASCDREESFFTLNKVSNLCEECHGLGTDKTLDVNRLIDYSKPLADNPIRCWNTYKDFYRQIIVRYCESICLDHQKTFRQLTPDEKEKILCGSSSDKFKIKYKKADCIASCTSKYYGIMTGHSMMPKFKPSKQFFSDKTCNCCGGKKFSAEHDQYRVSGLSIGEFMITPFSELLPKVNELQEASRNTQLQAALEKIRVFMTKAVELKLGHLNLHRAIPTLSGGELQRLKMVQVFNSQLNDLLIVLDEPLAGLSGNEKQTIYENILELAKHHTILIVDHSDIFVKAAKCIYALGPGSGHNGGKLIDFQEYLKSEAQKHVFTIYQSKSTLTLDIRNEVYQYQGAQISLAENGMNLITGASGVGKSTLLREYFPQKWDDYMYINPKPLGGSKNSCVATSIGIADRIEVAFSKKTSQDKKLFSNHTGNAGACPVCGGSGYVEYGYDSRTRINLSCEECEGTGFNRMLQKYKLNGKTIFDIWNMTLDEGADYFVSIDSKVSDTLKQATEILLGHVRIGQPTSSLSGGENIRLKILSAAKTRNKIVGIDEPFKGLSPSEIFRVSAFLEKMRAKGKTIVVIDHSEYAEQFFARRIELVNEKGILVGRQQ